MIKDRQNNVELTTEFLKVPGGDNGGSWAARIKGKPLAKGMNRHETHIIPVITLSSSRQRFSGFSDLLLWARRPRRPRHGDR